MAGGSNQTTVIFFCNEVWSDERRLQMAKFFTILNVIIIVSYSVRHGPANLKFSYI